MADYVTGTITKVTPDGRFGLVLFDTPYKGKAMGVINNFTRNRMLIMNTAGMLEVDTHVRCEKKSLTEGPEAMLLENVEPLEPPQHGMRVPSAERNQFADEMLAELLGDDLPDDQ